MSQIPFNFPCCIDPCAPLSSLLYLREDSLRKNVVLNLNGARYFLQGSNKFIFASYLVFSFNFKTKEVCLKTC